MDNRRPRYSWQWCSRPLSRRRWWPSPIPVTCLRSRVTGPMATVPLDSGPTTRASVCEPRAEDKPSLASGSSAMLWSVGIRSCLNLAASCEGSTDATVVTSDGWNWPRASFSSEQVLSGSSKSGGAFLRPRLNPPRPFRGEDKIPVTLLQCPLSLLFPATSGPWAAKKILFSVLCGTLYLGVLFPCILPDTWYFVFAGKIWRTAGRPARNAVPVLSKSYRTKPARMRMTHAASSTHPR